MKNVIVSLIVLFGFFQAEAQPEVGREAAGKFFSATPQRSPTSLANDEHYLAIHYGQFMESTSWEWGQRERAEKTGNFTFGVTYRIGPYWDNMDLNLRVEGDEYDIVGERPFKLSFMPLIIFPEATARFPLYFGAGAGFGVFARQVKDESSLSFDYQLIMGVRFFDVYNNAGFFLETGLRNHLLLLTSGQFNSVFLSAGAVFTF